MSVFSPRCTDKQKSYIYRIAYAPAVLGPDFMRRLSTLFGTMKALIKGTTFSSTGHLYGLSAQNALREFLRGVLWNALRVVLRSNSV